MEVDARADASGKRRAAVPIAFRIVPLAALAALLITTAPAVSHAASCELAFKAAAYRCSGTFDGGGSSQFCIRPDVNAPGDGVFALIENETLVFRCTCEAKGRAPNVQFGGASRGFFCLTPDTTLSGKVSGSRLTGQGYNPYAGIRSTFTCQAVAACP